MYITEGTNSDIISEFAKIRTEMLKDKIAFTVAIESKDYKKARTIAHGIHARCELFYRKLENTDITKSEALIGTAAKVVKDTAVALGVLYVAIEGSIKAMEVVRGHDLNKSDKKEVKKIVNNALFNGDTKKQTMALISSGALNSAAKICTSIIGKVNSGKEVDASDLNSYYVEIKQKMKVLCVKSKMLINEVDIAEKKFGALDKKKELEKELNDAKNILKESEEIIVNKNLMEIALETSGEVNENSFIFEYTYEEDNGKYVTESFKDIISPLRSLKEKIKNIKENKPDQYDSIKKIEEFLDKYENDIAKASKLLEEEPQKLQKKETNWLIRLCLEFIGMFASVALIEVAPVAACVLFFGSYILMFVDMIVTCVVLYIRGNDDVAVLKDLSKIKNALNKINEKKLSDKYKKKISSIKTKISDAEEMAYGKLKVAKESEDPEILAVNEACENGSITEEQRDELINSINVNRSLSNIIEESSNDEENTLKDKYNEVKRLVYERCASGEFSEDTREVILRKAYEKIFNVSETEATPAAQPMQSQSATKEDPETKKALDEMNKNIEKEMKDA